MNDVRNDILSLIDKAKPKDPMAFVRNIIKDKAIENINQSILQCNDCGMYSKTRTKGFGNPHGSVMIISDCATSEQFNMNRQIAPFENTQEWGYLGCIFDYYKVNTNELFFMNCVNCCPSKEVDGHHVYRCPNTNEIEKCSVYMKQMVDIMLPAMIILLGTVALNCFKKASMSKAHGQWMTAYTIPAIPIYSPTHIKDAKGFIPEEQREMMKNEMMNDFRTAFLYLQTRYPNNTVLLDKIA